jgi:hypothetical protein
MARRESGGAASGRRSESTHDKVKRSEKIRQFLVEHGCQDAEFDWKSQDFIEAHFHDLKGQLFLLRVHTAMNGLVEVFRVEDFFCAGTDRDDWNKTPGMDHVIEWLGDMLERKSLRLPPTTANVGKPHTS